MFFKLHIAEIVSKSAPVSCVFMDGAEIFGLTKHQVKPLEKKIPSWKICQWIVNWRWRKSLLAPAVAAAALPSYMQNGFAYDA